MAHPKKQGRRAAVQHRRKQRRLLLGAVALFMVAGVAVAIALTVGRGASDDASVSRRAEPPAAWNATPFSGGARLAVDRSDINYGSVGYEEQVAAVYRVKNVGDAPLNLGKPTVNTLEGC